MSRDANVICQLFVIHAVSAANESGNQILLLVDAAPGHDSLKCSVISAIELRDNPP